MKTQFKNKKAFTLIELLIVIAIIGILFIVLVSKVDFATDKAKATGVQTDFRSFQLALDTVAKENAGFNTFGFNTGDNAGAIPAGYAFESTEAENKTKGDGIRNSYDQGDKNLNGKQDVNGKDGYTGTTEVFTGRKIYTEIWTEVYTLVKPGTTGLDASAVFALESAINANLDPKLHITINAADGKITMANQARDPWKNEYHGVYISNAERDHGADRGAIIIYSNGANGKWGSAHDITNGVVTVTVPGNNTYGKDDYSIVSCYTCVNGFGEVQNLTTGFSNNQVFAGSNINNVPGVDVNNPSDLPEDTVDVLTLQPGLYETGSNYTKLLKSWDVLVSEGAFTISGTTLTNCNNKSLSGDLIISNDIQTIATNSFSSSQQLTSIVIPNSVTSVGAAAFAQCTGLKYAKLGNGLQEIQPNTFVMCTSLEDVDFPEGLKTIGMFAFRQCNIKTLKLPNTVEDISANAFVNSAALTDVYMPNNIKNIGSGAFQGCIYLRNVYVSSLEIWLNINFASANSNPLYCSYDMTSSDPTPNKLYINNELLTELIVPNNITTIKQYAFVWYESLTKVVLPESVTTLEISSFEGCGNLESITLSENITSIPTAAFADCNKLAKITLPSSIVSIGSSAFKSCNVLTIIEYKGTVAEWSNVSKGSNWCINNSIEIICLDGKASLN